MNIKLKAFLYFAGWTTAWIVFGSIINAGLIAVNVYSPEEKGPAITFFISSIIFVGGAVSLYKEIFTVEAGE